MLRLVHVLYGLQPRSTRAMPQIPASWQEFAFTRLVADLEAVEAGTLYAGNGEGDLVKAALRGAAGILARRDAAQDLRTSIENSGHPCGLVDPAKGEDFDQLGPDSVLIITVDDPLMALQRLAVYHRRQLAPTVVGITGSASAASVVEVATALVSHRFRTLTVEPLHNKEATIPIALTQLTSEHEVVLLGLGTDGPGELRFNANLTRPRIGIVTGIGPAQLEPGGDLASALASAAALIESLPQDGAAMLNADDPQTVALVGLTTARTLRYGLDPTAELRASEIVSHGLNGIAFRLEAGTETLMLQLPLFGSNSVHVALAAIACGRELGMQWDEIVAGLTPADAQLRLLTAPGLHGARLIDDTYEAGLESTIDALNLLAGLEGRLIIVLGRVISPDMADEAINRMIGVRTMEVANSLICVGERAAAVAEAAISAGMSSVHTVATTDEAIVLLERLLTADDYVLIKGERAQGLDRITTALQRRPEEEK